MTGIAAMGAIQLVIHTPAHSFTDEKAVRVRSLQEIHGKTAITTATN